MRSGSTAARSPLEVRNSQYGSLDTFTDLSLDPASPAYAVRRIFDAYVPGKRPTNTTALMYHGFDNGLPFIMSGRPLGPQDTVSVADVLFPDWPGAARGLDRPQPLLRQNGVPTRGQVHSVVGPHR